MAEAIRLGRMTDTMEEGFLAELNIKVGDKIKAGDTLAEVETDKATLPLESYYTGTVLHVAAKKGDTLKIGDLIAVVGKEGEDYTALLEQTTDNRQQTTESKAAVDSSSKQKELTPSVAESSKSPLGDLGVDRIKASPLARTIAKEKGIDLSKVQGTGEEGRITKRDLESVSSSKVSKLSMDLAEGK